MQRITADHIEREQARIQERILESIHMTEESRYGRTPQKGSAAGVYLRQGQSYKTGERKCPLSYEDRHLKRQREESERRRQKRS